METVPEFRNDLRSPLVCLFTSGPVYKRSVCLRLNNDTAESELSAEVSYTV